MNRVQDNSGPGCATQAPLPVLPLLKIIHEALRNGRQLRLNCRHYSRVVIPHSLEGGEADPVIVAWQVSGGCETGVITGLKRFHLSEIYGMSVLPQI